MDTRAMADEQAQAGFELAQSPSHLLHRAQQSAVNLSAPALSEQGLTLRQFAVLAALSSEEGQSQASLVNQTGIDRSTLADMVSRMERAGYIERTESTEDRRAKVVSLKPKGRTAYEAALPAVAEADRQLLDMIRANRRTGFLTSLATIGGPDEVRALPVAEEPGAEEPAPEGDAKPKKSKDKAEKPSKSDKSDKSDKGSKSKGSKSKKKKKKKKK